MQAKKNPDSKVGIGEFGVENGGEAGGRGYKKPGAMAGFINKIQR